MDGYFKLFLQELDISERHDYDPPWTIPDEDGNTILHLALSNNLPGSWLNKIVACDPAMPFQVNNKSERPHHVLLRTACDPELRRQLAEKAGSSQAYDIADNLKFIIRGDPGGSCNSDINGFTPLLIAAQAKELEYFNILLKAHVEKDKLGFTSCDLKSTYEGDPDCNTFWHHLANTQGPDDYYDAVQTEATWMQACSHACKALTYKNKSGKTPFHVAIDNDNFKVAKMFTKTLHGDGSQEPHSVYKDMGDDEGNVPLHLVIGRCELSSVREFIKCMATSTESIAVPNTEGITPLHLAVFKQDIEFLNIIFDVKRDDKAFTHQILRITDKDHNTALHYAILQGAFVDMFIGKGIWSDCIDEILCKSNMGGNTPLHLAVMIGDSSLARKLADIAKEKNCFEEMLGKQDKNGNTALHLTVAKGDAAIAQIFIKIAKDIKYIKGLLEKGNNDRDTALHLAIKNRDFKLVKCFIEHAIEDSCISKILDIPNNKDETAGSLIGSAVHLPNKFEKYFWNEPKVVQAMLGVRSLSGVPTKMIKEYTN